MASKYEFIGLIALEPGDWADWFSGASSFAAVLVALGGYWFSERLRRRQERERELEAGRLIGWKLVRLLNASHDIYRHFWIAPDPSMKGFTGEVEAWRSTHPLLGAQIDPSIALSPSDENLLLKSKSTELLMQFSLAYGRYTSIVYSVQEYKSRFDILHNLMPAPSAADGNVLTHRVTQEEAMSLHLHSLQLDSIIEGIKDLTHENVKNCISMMTLLDEMYCRYFGKILFNFEPNSDVGDFENLGKLIARN